MCFAYRDLQFFWRGKVTQQNLFACLICSQDKDFDMEIYIYSFFLFVISLSLSSLLSFWVVHVVMHLALLSVCLPMDAHGMVFYGSQGKCPSHLCTLGLPPGLDLDACKDVVTQFYDTVTNQESDGKTYSLEKLLG